MLNNQDLGNIYDGKPATKIDKREKLQNNLFMMKIKKEL